MRVEQVAQPRPRGAWEHPPAERLARRRGRSRATGRSPPVAGPRMPQRRPLRRGVAHTGGSLALTCLHRAGTKPAPAELGTWLSGRQGLTQRVRRVAAHSAALLAACQRPPRRAGSSHVGLQMLGGVGNMLTAWPGAWAVGPCTAKLPQQLSRTCIASELYILSALAAKHTLCSAPDANPALYLQGQTGGPVTALWHTQGHDRHVRGLSRKVDRSKFARAVASPRQGSGDSRSASRQLRQI